MDAVANHAYAGTWTKGFSEATMLAQFEALLDTVPFSASCPGFTQLVLRALKPAEAPLAEHDLRARPLRPAELAGITREHLHADSCYEATAHWDLWTYIPEPGWQLRPQRLEITCFGTEYDSGICAEVGHFHVDLGFEHLFTGHAGLLGHNGRPVARPQHAAEAAFLETMGKPEKLREYYAKTHENIRKLLDWMGRIATSLPVEQSRLWSEGEENFEARLDEIMAAR